METSTENFLDVTLLEPRKKHPTIFARFDELKNDESLTIYNDHDPKPLYYQLLGERGNIFTWEYLEQGPQWWKVKITKRVQGESDETLGEIAIQDLRKAQIFKKYGLDFCCGGKKTVKEACAEKGIDPVKVEQELKQTDKMVSTARPLPYNEWNLDFLADYIVNTHHAYIRKTLPDLCAYAEKVMHVHSGRHPELKKINELIEATANELSSHMAKEEQILFPYIKNLVVSQNNNEKLAASRFAGIQNPIQMMEQEHELVGNYLHKARGLANNYQLPQDACATYSLLYRLMDEFEEDLHLHIHLENNILFPKAIKMEKTLIQN